MRNRHEQSAADDLLLADLTGALAPEDVSPPATTVSALRTAVAARDVPTTVRPNRVPRIRHKWALAGGILAALIVGTGTSFAAGVPVPPPIRILATNIGLPVTPQPVVDVRNATSTLEQQLHAVPSDPPATAVAAGHLAGLIHNLAPSQRTQVPPIAPHLLQQACAQVFPSTGQPSSDTGGKTTGWAGCPVVGATSGSTTGPVSTTSTTAAGTHTGSTAVSGTGTASGGRDGVGNGSPRSPQPTHPTTTTTWPTKSGSGHQRPYPPTTTTTSWPTTTTRSSNSSSPRVTSDGQSGSGYRGGAPAHRPPTSGRYGARGSGSGQGAYGQGAYGYGSQHGAPAPTGRSSGGEGAGWRPASPSRSVPSRGGQNRSGFHGPGR